MRWSLQLTTDFGDPDVYVSRTDQQPGPNMREWQAALQVGLDHITVDWMDPVYANQTMVGTYYVGVVAWIGGGDASYRLVLTIETEDGVSTPITLEQGIPQTRALSANSMAYYRFAPGAQGWPYVTIISVIPTAGDPDLYVGRNYYPNSTVSMYRSTQGPGQADTVYMVPNATNAAMICNPTLIVIGGTSCFYGIAVLLRAAVALSHTSHDHERQWLHHACVAPQRTADAGSDIPWRLHHLLVHTQARSHSGVLRHSADWQPGSVCEQQYFDANQRRLRVQLQLGQRRHDRHPQCQLAHLLPVCPLCGLPVSIQLLCDCLVVRSG